MIFIFDVTVVFYEILCNRAAEESISVMMETWLKEEKTRLFKESIKKDIEDRQQKEQEEREAKKRAAEERRKAVVDRINRQKEEEERQRVEGPQFINYQIRLFTFCIFV